MDMVAKAGAALQQLLGPIAAAAAAKTRVIKRVRIFTPFSLAATFVLGFLKKPDASVDDLTQMAVQCGAEVSSQAVDQRRTPELANFLEEVFRESIQVAVASTASLAPILDRFESVSVGDSTTITLPESEQKKFSGCGGSYDTSKAAVKLQVELDLRSGALSHIEIEQGKSPDGATCRQHVSRGKGSLRITDLGFFNVSVFEEMDQAEEYFLSRLQFGTNVLLPDGTPLPKLLRWLEDQCGPFVDQRILLGAKNCLPCRLIAWRIPTEQANRRRQKLCEEMKRKKGKTPSQERLAWCDWSILVTNVPPEKLSPTEAVVLYRSRWQIELLFKRWKSSGLVANLDGSTDVLKMIKVWSRLVASIVQHWLLVASTWGDARLSLDKAAETIREYINRITASLGNMPEFLRAMNDLAKVIAKTCRRNKRTKPGTFELLNNPELLDFRLA